MIGRITSTQLLAQSQANMQTALARLSLLQEQASSGSRISKPSDDPAGTGQSLLIHGQQTALTQYGRNVDDGIGWLATIDTAFTNSTGLLQRARTLVLEAANSGTMSAQSREAVATELETIRDDLRGQANTRYNGRSVFAGTSDANAFDASYAYSGTAGSTVERRIGDDTTVRVDADGAAAFGSGATSIFAELDATIADVRSGADVTGHIAQIDSGLNAIFTQQAVSGTRYSQLERAQDSVLAQSVALEGRRSSVEDVDTAQVLVELQSQNLAYQSALAVTAKSLPLSLLSFLD